MPKFSFAVLIIKNIHPIIGTTSSKHMEEDLDIFSFSLSDEECELIKKVGPIEKRKGCAAEQGR